VPVTLEQCRGCEDDFYNHGGRSTTGRCWSATTGEMKVRYRTGTWTMPASPGAFTEVRVPTCYRQKGSHYSDRLPNFVKAEDVVRLRAREMPPALHPGAETTADRDDWEF
jgi:hypothetical protein